ncbi:hypothetical protein S245_026999, partial [Arachis hypogaea]
MKSCELCKVPARTFCESDQASLCWDCDANVHGANFLVARHTRTLLCHACQSPTPWKASGDRLGNTVSLCEMCAGGNKVSAEESEGGNDDDIDTEDDDLEDEEEEEDDDDDEVPADEEEEEDGDNQVVPWSSTAPPPPAPSSSSSEESVSRRCNHADEEDFSEAVPLKRHRHDVDHDDFLLGDINGDTGGVERGGWLVRIRRWSTALSAGRSSPAAALSMGSFDGPRGCRLLAVADALVEPPKPFDQESTWRYLSRTIFWRWYYKKLFIKIVIES